MSEPAVRKVRRRKARPIEPPPDPRLCKPVHAVKGMTDAWACMGCGRHYHLGRVHQGKQPLLVCEKSLTGSFWERVAIIDSPPEPLVGMLDDVLAEPKSTP